MELVRCSTLLMHTAKHMIWGWGGGMGGDRYVCKHVGKLTINAQNDSFYSWKQTQIQPPATGSVSAHRAGLGVGGVLFTVTELKRRKCRLYLAVQDAVSLLVRLHFCAEIPGGGWSWGILLALPILLRWVLCSHGQLFSSLATYGLKKPPQ